MGGYWQQYRNRRLGRRQVLAGGATAAVGLAGLMVGCGDDDASETPTGSNPDGQTQTAGQSPGSSPGSSPTVAAKKGGVIRVSDQDPNAWDIYTVSNATLSSLSSMVRDSLLEVPMTRGTNPWDTTIKPALAQSWEQPDKEGLTYTLKVDPRAKYSGVAPVNGRKFTADDVVYTMKYMLAKTTWSNRGFFSRIESVQAADSQTVSIKMSQPYAPLLTYLASHWLQMYAPEMDGKHDKPENSVGTGFMIFDKYQPGVSVTYKSNPDYWRGAPNIDGFEQRIVSDQNTAIALFKSGELHAVGGSGASLDVLRSVGGGKVENYPGTAAWSLRGRSDQPPFNDQRIRQAMSMAINREQWLQAFLGGKGSLGDESLGGQMLLPQEAPWALSRKELGESVKWISYDLSEAKKLMSAAAPGGVTVDMVTYSLPDYIQRAEAVREMLKQVGITANIKGIDRGQFLQTALLGQYDGLSLYAWLAPYDPDEFWFYWKSGQQRNDAKVNDPKIDDLIEKQRTQVDPQQRKVAWADLQRYTVDKCYYIFGPIGDTPTLVGDKVLGWKVTPFYSRRNLQFVSFA